MTIVAHHLGQLPQLLGSCRVLVVADPALAETAALRALRGPLPGAALLVRDTWARIGDAEAVATAITAYEAVLAYGGGSVLDCVKVAVALHDPAVRKALAAPDRCGWVTAASGPPRRTLVAVPTTLGTASEVSVLASLVQDDAKRLLGTPTLAPYAALVLPAALRGTTRRQQLEGGLEVLFRVLGAYIGDPADRPGADERALGLAESAVEALLGLCAAPDLGTPDTDRLRCALVHIGQRSHAPDVVGSRPPFGNKAWFLANNLAHATGQTKVAALAMVLPRVWQAIPTDPVLGNATHLARAWGRLRCRLPYAADPDPAAGLRELLARLGVGGTPAPADAVEAIGHSCRHMWGAGLPMLAGTTPASLVRLLGGADRDRPEDLPRRQSRSPKTPRQLAAV